MADRFERSFHLIADIFFMFILALLGLKFFFRLSYFQWIPSIFVLVLGIFMAIYWVVAGIQYWTDGEYDISDIVSGLALAASIFTIFAGIMLILNNDLGTLVSYAAGLTVVVGFLLFVPKLIKSIKYVFE